MSQNRAEDIIPYLEKYFKRIISRIDKGEYHGNQSYFDYIDLSRVRNKVCGAGSNYIVIDSNRDIYTCHESIKFGKTLSNCFTQNNIFDDIKRGFSLNCHIKK